MKTLSLTLVPGTNGTTLVPVLSIFLTIRLSIAELNYYQLIVRKTNKLLEINQADFSF